MLKIENLKLKIFFVVLLMVVLQGVKADSFKVLFLGNSHTFWNDLPQLTMDLALANGDTMIYEQNTPGGCTLGHPSNGHLYNPVSLALIDSMDWDYVILQEHSLFAVIDYYRDTYMYPGAKSLDSLIKLNNECTETILQVIWGKKYGGQHCISLHCTIDFENFAHMQDSLTAEYLRLADTLSCTVAPSGEAFKKSILSGDPIELFDPDESHPSLAGSYLSACVYYSVLFQKSPMGIPFFGGLSMIDAIYLQEIAHGVVFGSPDLWNINGNIPIAGFDIYQIENTVICTDTSVNADYYFWNFGDGTTDTIQNPTHEYFSNGTYIITQEVSTSCHSDVTSDTVIIDLINSISNTNSVNGINVLQESGKGQFRIISKSSKINQIRIYSLDGAIKYSRNLNGIQEYSFIINHLSPGFYILAIEGSRGISTYKIIF